jgi:hypothetical protein
MTDRIVARRICWPDPDNVCLQGGCSYCNDEEYQPLWKIWQYSKDVGLAADYIIGRKNDWWGRVEFRKRGMK